MIQRQYTYDEAAELLRCKPDTLRKKAAEGKIEVIRYSHTLVRIEESELRRFIDRHRIPREDN